MKACNSFVDFPPEPLLSESQLAHDEVPLEWGEEGERGEGTVVEFSSGLVREVSIGTASVALENTTGEEIGEKGEQLSPSAPTKEKLMSPQLSPSAPTEEKLMNPQLSPSASTKEELMSNMLHSETDSIPEDAQLSWVTQQLRPLSHRHPLSPSRQSSEDQNSTHQLEATAVHNLEASNVTAEPLDTQSLKNAWENSLTQAEAMYTGLEMALDWPSRHKIRLKLWKNIAWVVIDLPFIAMSLVVYLSLWRAWTLTARLKAVIYPLAPLSLLYASLL